MIKLRITITIVVMIALGTALTGSVAQADDIAGKCGTSARVREYYERAGKGEKPRQVTACDETFVSPSGFFVIWYCRTGDDAVPTADADRNGIPDFVDSCAYYMDHALRVECDSMGYPRPPLGPDTEFSTPQYDIILRDLAAEGAYGYTTPMADLPKTGHPRNSSYIVMDNNFSPLDRRNGRQVYRTTGYDGLKITCGHEFHHSIQMGVYGYDQRQDMMYEAMSTFLEWRLFPTIPDYVQYANIAMSRPDTYSFGQARAESGYSQVPFLQYLYLGLGDTVMRYMWDRIGEGESPSRALDMALISTGISLVGLSLDDAYCKFLPWLYHTGQRSIGTRYLPDARLINTLVPREVVRYQDPGVSMRYNVGPFEPQLVAITLPVQGFTKPDTIHVLTTFRGTNVISDYRFGTTNYAVQVSQQPGGQRIENTDYFLAQSDNPLACGHVFSAIIAENPGYVYPQPYDLVSNDDLLFPSPEPARVGVDCADGDEVILTVYTPEMSRVLSKTLRACLDRSSSGQTGRPRKVVFLPQTEARTLIPGVYIFTTEYKGIVASGKFAVKGR